MIVVLEYSLLVHAHFISLSGLLITRKRGGVSR